MFCIFKNNQFVNFWENVIGDIFIDITCKSMKWNREEIDLVFYSGINVPPLDFEFDENKILKIKQKNVDQQMEVNEAGEPILDENGNAILFDVVSYTIRQTIEPDFFMSKGIIVKPC